MADRPQATNVQEVFKEMPNRFNAGAAKGMKAVYQFDLTGDGGGKYNARHRRRQAHRGGGRARVPEHHASPWLPATTSTW